MQTASRDKWGYVALMAFVAAVFAAMNALTTLKGDDILYSYISGTYYEPFERWSDLWRSKLGHYAECNGRLSDTIAQLFLGYAGRGAFAVCNTLMAILLVDVLRRSAAPDAPLTAAGIAIVAILLWFVPVPGETMLWLCGACNYLWPATLTLWLLWWLSRHGNGKHGIACHMAIALAAFVAGNLNEAIAVPTVAGCACYLALNRRLINSLNLTALIAAVIGIAIIFASPGTLSRATGELGGDATVLHHLKQLVRYGVKYHLLPGIAAIVLVMRACRRDRSTLIADAYAWIWLMTTAMLAVLGNDHNERPYFYWSIVSIIIVVKQGAALLAGHRTGLRLITGAAALAMIAAAVHGLQVIYRYKLYDDTVRNKIAAAPDVAVLPASDFQRNRWAMVNLYDSERYNGYGPVYKTYYGKRTIAFLRPPFMEHYEAHDSLLDGGVAQPYKSSLPGVIDSVYYFEDRSFTLVPVDSTVTLPPEPELTFHVEHPERRAAHPERYPYKGLCRHDNMVWYYELQDRAGQRYLVIPPADDDVTAYTIPVMVAGTARRCTLTRQ